MIVTILRHGQAGVASTDQQRQLTSRGVHDITSARSQFSSSCESRDIPKPDLILYSAWLRTTQTAQLFSSAFPDASVLAESSLLPGGHISEVDETLFALQQDDTPSAHVVLVSHQPLVSELVDYYLGVPNTVPPMSPGALVCLQMDAVGQACSVLRFWSSRPGYEANL